MSNYKQLLVVAVDLASSNNPSEAALRRSISTLYYAVFHRLMQLCADALVPEGQENPAWERVYRSLNHAQTNDQLKKMGKNGTSPFKTFSQKFETLQIARVLADYVPLQFPKTQGDVLLQIRENILELEILENLTQPQRLALAVHILIPGAKR